MISPKSWSFVLCCALTFLSSFGKVEAQCFAPAGPYTMFIDASTINVVSCPGTSFRFGVRVDGGTQDLAGFGFNIVIDMPGRITSVVPGFNPTGGGFISTVGPTGNTVAVLGIKPTSLITPLDLVATITFAPQVIAQPGNFDINFGGSLALPNGIIPIDHVVEANSGCDVVAPVLGLRGAVVRVSTCAGNFIRGDCNNNGSVAGLTGDIWFLLNSLFNGGPLPACTAACDADDDDIVDISDAIYLLNWLTNTGSPPPPPSPLQGQGLGSCGPDPTLGLSCTGGICP